MIGSCIIILLVINLNNIIVHFQPYISVFQEIASRYQLYMIFQNKCQGVEKYEAHAIHTKGCANINLTWSDPSFITFSICKCPTQERLPKHPFLFICVLVVEILDHILKG